MTIRWLLAAVHLLALGVGLGAVWARGVARCRRRSTFPHCGASSPPTPGGASPQCYGSVPASSGRSAGTRKVPSTISTTTSSGRRWGCSPHGSASSRPYSWCSWSWRPRRWRAGTACRRDEVNCSPILERFPCPMCRNIKRLRHPDHAPTDAELHDAALQFVRKISGFHAPSKANEAAFNAAVHDVAAAGRVLFRSLHVRGHADATA